MNKNFNSYLDRVFQEKMKEANDAGIDAVEDYGSVNTFQNANNKARYKLFRIVGENDDECGIAARFDGHTLAVTNKNIGNGFLAMFD